MKGTPRKNPRKRGGSPKGVSNPPQLATMKIANRTVWTR